MRMGPLSAGKIVVTEKMVVERVSVVYEVYIEVVSMVVVTFWVSV